MFSVGKTGWRMWFLQDNSRQDHQIVPPKLFCPGKLECGFELLNIHEAVTVPHSEGTAFQDECFSQKYSKCICPKDSKFTDNKNLKQFQKLWRTPRNKHQSCCPMPKTPENQLVSLMKITGGGSFWSILARTAHTCSILSCSPNTWSVFAATGCCFFVVLGDFRNDQRRILWGLLWWGSQPWAAL